MNETLTAESFITSKLNIPQNYSKISERYIYTEVSLEEVMIEFTQYHVKLALEAASAQVEFDEEVLIRATILQAYPLENII